MFKPMELLLIGIVSNVLFGVVTPVLAENPVCTECSKGIQEVSLCVISKEKNQSLTEQANWYNWCGKHSESDDYVPLVVSNPLQIRDAIEQIARKCQKLKFLGIYSDGAPGYSRIGDPLDVNNVKQVFGGLSCAMAKDAKVDLSGSQIGRSCRGEDFLMSVGKELLAKNGGSVQAATSYVHGPIIAPFSINFDYQYLYLEPGLTNPRWDNTARTQSECMGELYEINTTIENHKEKTRYCNEPDTQADREKLDQISQAVSHARGLQSKLSNRTGFDALHETTAKAYAGVFDLLEKYNAVLKKIEKALPCFPSASLPKSGPFSPHCNPKYGPCAVPGN